MHWTARRYSGVESILTTLCAKWPCYLIRIDPAIYQQDNARHIRATLPIHLQTYDATTMACQVTISFANRACLRPIIRPRRSGVICAAAKYMAGYLTRVISDLIESMPRRISADSCQYGARTTCFLTFLRNCNRLIK
ncbi:hypothetical protein TNCV_1754571 [Trichonephila clavipes]|nr:hypothetical protein TNCV_1754571 [Trichonephila clavipes]